MQGKPYDMKLTSIYDISNQNSIFDAASKEYVVFNINRHMWLPLIINLKRLFDKQSAI
ncbi:hypothetical protein GCM10027566_09540 [Arachidicoccus ginsenosidivorans]|jgi:hypothetical protein